MFNHGPVDDVKVFFRFFVFGLGRFEHVSKVMHIFYKNITNHYLNLQKVYVKYDNFFY